MKFLERKYTIPLAIVAFGLLFLVPFSGRVPLFDWDEIIFAESAREMIVSGDYLTVAINYEPFWEKPPLFMWLQVISMKIFGINEFAARFPNAICGIITLLSLFYAGKRIRNRKLGLLWAASFGTAILPFFYFNTGIIDPWFNLFIFLGFFFFILYIVPGATPVSEQSPADASGSRNPTPHLVSLLLSAAFLGLAVLTKGPVAILIFGLSFLVYLVFKRGRIRTTVPHVLLFIFVFLAVGGSWFLIAIMKGNFEVVKDFVEYQAGLFSDDFAGHSGFPGFHIVILLFGVFPASAILFAGITRKKEEDPVLQDFRLWMYILLLLVLVLFSLVETKLVHYSSMAWYPITFLAAWTIYQWTERQLEFRIWHRVLLTFIWFVFSAVALIIPLIMRDPAVFLERFPNITDPYVEGVLMTDAGWSVLDFLPAIMLIIGGVVSQVWISKRDLKGIISLKVIILLFTFSSMMLFVPKVEKMVQGPAIEFMKTHSGDNEYVAALGFKSFGPYFYGEWMPEDLDESEKGKWLEGDFLDKPMYIVMKADKAEKLLRQYPALQQIGSEGGFVFAKIDPR